MLVFSSKMVSNIINEYISIFEITIEIDKKTEKLELNMNIELGRAVLSTISANEMIVSN